MVSQQSTTKPLDRLTAMGGPRESSSDVILRLASNGRGALVVEPGQSKKGGECRFGGPLRAVGRPACN